MNNCLEFVVEWKISFERMQEEREQKKNLVQIY